MKIAVFITNPIRSPYKNDQYDSFRSEGRYSINMGFGLALLNFEVNLIMNEWNVDANKQVTNNVYLSNVPKYNHYDYVLTWSINDLYKITFDKAVFMDWAMLYVNDIYQYKEKVNKNIIYTCPAKYFVEYTVKNNIKFPIEIHYLPTLYPISSINIGFMPYNSKLTDNNEKVIIYIYNNTEKITNKYTTKQQFIINYLRNKFKDRKLELIVHTGSRGTEQPSEINTIRYLYDKEARYIDIINSISSSDLCIIPGSNNSGPSILDTISLGKPTLFISDSIVNKDKDLFTNCIYEFPDYLFYLQDTDIETSNKLENFIQSPEVYYNKFKDAYKDLDFIKWKDYARKFFIQ